MYIKSFAGNEDDMKTSESYEADVLAFFGDKSWALTLYHTLFDRMEQVFPEAAVKVQKVRSASMAVICLRRYLCRCGGKRPGRRNAWW